MQRESDAYILKHQRKQLAMPFIYFVAPDFKMANKKHNLYFKLSTFIVSTRYKCFIKEL